MKVIRTPWNTVSAAAGRRKLPIPVRVSLPPLRETSCAWRSLPGNSPSQFSNLGLPSPFCRLCHYNTSEPEGSAADQIVSGIEYPTVFQPSASHSIFNHRETTHLVPVIASWSRATNWAWHVAQINLHTRAVSSSPACSRVRTDRALHLLLEHHQGDGHYERVRRTGQSSRSTGNANPRTEFLSARGPAVLLFSVPTIGLLQHRRAINWNWPIQARAGALCHPGQLVSYSQDFSRAGSRAKCRHQMRSRQSNTPAVDEITGQCSLSPCPRARSSALFT